LEFGEVLLGPRLARTERVLSSLFIAALPSRWGGIFGKRPQEKRGEAGKRNARGTRSAVKKGISPPRGEMAEKAPATAADLFAL